MIRIIVNILKEFATWKSKPETAGTEQSERKLEVVNVFRGKEKSWNIGETLAVGSIPKWSHCEIH